MKKEIRFYKTKYFFIGVLSFLFAIFTAIGLSSYKKSYAVSYFDVLPYNIKTELELTEISSPTGICIDGDAISVISDDGISFYFTNGNKITVPISDFEGDVKHITRFNENSYLIIDNAKLKKIVINADETYTVSVLKTVGEEAITGNVYDFDGNKLVVGFEEKITYYSVDQTYSITKLKQFSGVDSNRPVLLNGDSLFYINGNLLYKSTIPNEGDTLLNTKTVSSSANNISKMIYNNGYIYYIGTDKNINKVSENGGTITKLNFSYSAYELGKASSPTAIYFYDGYLFVADNGGSIQQFSLIGNTLSFTGYALANGKTAFNRIDKNSFDVEKYGDRIAVMSFSSVKIYSGDEDGVYNSSNYTEINNGANNYTAFALGKNKLLLSDKQNKFIRLYDLENKTLSSKIYFNSSTGYIADVCYQNGYFYILQAVRSKDEPTKNREIAVYKMKEGATSYSQVLKITKADYFADGEMPFFEVSENGTIFIGTTANNDHDIYAYYKDANGNYSETDFSILGDSDNILKLKTDFNNVLYALYDNRVVRFIGEEQDEFTVNNKSFSSFAFSIEENEVFFISPSSEVIFSSDALPIVALNDIDVPDAFILNGSTDAKPIDKLKLYSIKNPEYAYLVNTDGGKFSFISNLQESVKATKICDFSYTVGGTDSENTEMVILIAFNDSDEMQTILTTKNNLSEISFYKTDDTAFSYVSTNVGIYYLPIITKNIDFAMEDNGEKIRLNRETEIKVIKTIDYLGTKFYYAETTVNGVKYTGYIPVNFTATVLPSKIESQNFYTAYVFDGKVYSSAELDEVIFNVEDGDLIRVYGTENGILKISFYNGSFWQEGYILESTVKTAPNNTTRNVIIICVVALSLCGTTIFFVLKKKKDF